MLPTPEIMSVVDRFNCKDEADPERVRFMILPYCRVYLRQTSEGQAVHLVLRTLTDQRTFYPLT